MKPSVGVETDLHAFLTSALHAGEGSALRPGRFMPWERAPGPLDGKLQKGERTGGLGACEKRKFSYSCWESNHDGSVGQLVSSSVYRLSLPYFG